MTREFLIIPLANKEAQTIYDAFIELRRNYIEHFDEVFKTITTDNGSEFANLSDLESVAQTLVYYAHPYTSCEKGSVERHNGIIRRLIPAATPTGIASGTKYCSASIQRLRSSWSLTRQARNGLTKRKKD